MPTQECFVSNLKRIQRSVFEKFYSTPSVSETFTQTTETNQSSDLQKFPLQAYEQTCFSLIHLSCVQKQGVALPHLP